MWASLLSMQFWANSPSTGPPCLGPTHSHMVAWNSSNGFAYSCTLLIRSWQRASLAFVATGEGLGCWHPEHHPGSSNNSSSRRRDSRGS